MRKYKRTIKICVLFKRDEENFPPPEITSTVNREELGNLKLTKEEEEDIVEFIKTLTDGYQ